MDICESCGVNRNEIGLLIKNVRVAVDYLDERLSSSDSAINDSKVATAERL